MSHRPIFLFVFCHIIFCVTSLVWYMLWALACVQLLTFMLRPHISLSMFSLWLCNDNQSLINSSGPGLYSMCTMYWCMCIIMHCRHCGNVATSLPIIASSDLLSGMTCTQMQNSSGQTYPTYAEPWLLLSIYCCSATQCYIGSCCQR